MKQDSKEFIKGQGKAKKEAKADAEAEVEKLTKAIKDATFTDQTPRQTPKAVFILKHAGTKKTLSERMDNEHKLTTLEPKPKRRKY